METERLTHIERRLVLGEGVAFIQDDAMKYVMVEYTDAHGRMSRNLVFGFGGRERVQQAEELIEILKSYIDAVEGEVR